jgi:hypothetical protein
MWAVVVNVEINDVAEARAGLEEVVASVRLAPGFVAGYWIQLEDTQGTSIAVFDATEEQVRAGMPEQGSSARGVTMTSVQMGEVLAHA